MIRPHRRDAVKNPMPGRRLLAEKAAANADIQKPTLVTQAV
jgi:hypothetical protein